MGDRYYRQQLNSIAAHWYHQEEQVPLLFLFSNGQPKSRSCIIQIIQRLSALRGNPVPSFNESSRQWGLLFVLVGPPGVGKNAMMNTVLSQIPSLRQLPTATTRPMRPNEQEGREHLFVSPAEFQRMIDEGDLIEWQVVHGYQYGTPRSTVQQAMSAGQDLIADIEVLGATYLRSIFPENVVLIFVQPPSVDELVHRMHNRGETESEIQKRMQRVEMEMRYAAQCDYLITNDSIDRASDILRSIILAEYSRRDLKRLQMSSVTPTPA